MRILLCFMLCLGLTACGNWKQAGFAALKRAECQQSKPAGDCTASYSDEYRDWQREEQTRKESKM